jgi:hypothetical protein
VLSAELSLHSRCAPVCQSSHLSRAVAKSVKKGYRAVLCGCVDALATEGCTSDVVPRPVRKLRDRKCPEPDQYVEASKTSIAVLLLTSVPVSPACQAAIRRFNHIARPRLACCVIRLVSCLLNGKGVDPSPHTHTGQLMNNHLLPSSVLLLTGKLVCCAKRRGKWTSPSANH